jgi:hypothetical protein
MVLVGNKCESGERVVSIMKVIAALLLFSFAQISAEDAVEQAKQWSLPHVSTSAKVSVSNIFLNSLR